MQFKARFTGIIVVDMNKVTLAFYQFPKLFFSNIVIRRKQNVHEKIVENIISIVHTNDFSILRTYDHYFVINVNVVN